MIRRIFARSAKMFCMSLENSDAYFLRFDIFFCARSAEKGSILMRKNVRRLKNTTFVLNTTLNTFVFEALVAVSVKMHRLAANYVNASIPKYQLNNISLHLFSYYQFSFSLRSPHANFCDPVWLVSKIGNCHFR